MSFTHHSRTAWGIDAYSDADMRYPGHHPLTSQRVSPQRNYQNNNFMMSRRPATAGGTRRNHYAQQQQQQQQQQRYIARQQQQRIIKPPVKKLHIHLHEMQASLQEMERRFHSVRHTLRPSQQQAWIDKIKLVRTERDMIYLEMQAQATLGLGPVPGIPTTGRNNVPNINQLRNPNSQNYKLTSQVQTRKELAKNPPLRYELNPRNMGGPLPYSSIHPSNVNTIQSHFDFNAVKEDLKIPERRPSTAPAGGRRNGGDVEEEEEGDEESSSRSNNITGSIPEQQSWTDTKHTYKSGIYMYNGKSVVIDGKFNNYNNNSYNSGNRNDAALNRRRNRIAKEREEQRRKMLQQQREEILKEENGEKDAFLQVKKKEIPTSTNNNSSSSSSSTTSNNKNTRNEIVKPDNNNNNKKKTNFKHDVVDIGELMQIKSIKSYKKLYDPDVVSKLERIKAIGGYGKRSPSRKTVEKVEAANAPIANSNSNKKIDQVNVEIDHARQSLKGFKMERSLLQQEMEDATKEIKGSGSIGDGEENSTPAVKSSKVTNIIINNKNNYVKDNETKSDAKKNDPTLFNNNKEEGDNNNKLLADALKRIQNLELEVKEWKRAAKDAATVSLSQSIVGKMNLSDSIDDIVKLDLQRELKQKKRKKVSISKSTTNDNDANDNSNNIFMNNNNNNNGTNISSPSRELLKKKQRLTKEANNKNNEMTTILKPSSVSTNEEDDTTLLQSFDLVEENATATATTTKIDDDKGKLALFEQDDALLRSFDVVEISALMERDGIKFVAGIEKNQRTRKSNTLADFDIVETVLENVVKQVVIAEENEESSSNNIDHFDIVEKNILI